MNNDSDKKKSYMEEMEVKGDLIGHPWCSKLASLSMTRCDRSLTRGLKMRGKFWSNHCEDGGNERTLSSRVYPELEICADATRVERWFSPAF